VGSIVATIGGVDVSARLKGLAVNGSGPGVVGDATLYLDQPAGGLSILNMMDVRVWRAHTGSAGVAQRGRLFGGLVTVRNTGNFGTSKTWELPCSSYQLIAHKTVRDLASAWTVNLTAANFDTMIAQLILIIQRNNAASVNTAIDATSQVANLGAMPAMSLEPGHSMAWYLDQVCLKAHELYPTVRPAWFLDTERTFGIADVFGPPTLHAYDAALTPLSSFTFSDVPTGGEFPILNMSEGGSSSWKRRLDASEIVQRLQSHRPYPATGIVRTYEVAASQVTYPNRYINHGEASDTGFWMNEPLEDTQSQNLAQQDALLKATVDPLAYPRERISFWTNQTVAVGDVVTVEYALEGLAGVDYRVMGAVYDFADPLREWTHLDLNARRLELLESGTEIVAAPVENNTNPPDPPTNLAIINVAGETDAPHPSRMRRVGFDWDLSPSPNVAYQAIVKRLGNLIEPYQVTNTQDEWWSEFLPSRQYTVQVFAVSGSGRFSEPAEITFTTNGPEPSDSLFNGDFQFPQPDNPGKAEGWAESDIIGIFLPNRVTAVTAGIAGISSKYLYAIGLGSNAQGVLTSDPVKVTNPAGIAAIEKVANIASQFIYRTSLTNLTIGATVQYRDKGGASTGTLAVFTPGTATPSQNTLITLTKGALPPPNTVYMELVLTFSSIAAGTVYIGACELEPALPGTKVASVVDIQSELDFNGGGTLALDPETADGFTLHNTAGADVGYFEYGSSTVSMRAISPNNLQLEGGSAGAFIDLIAGGIRFGNQAGAGVYYKFTDDGSVVLADGAYATNATEGFTYLPSMAGTATGTPTTYTGTVPIVVDTSGERVGLYLGGAWKWLAPGGTSGRFEPLVFDNDIVFFDGNLVMVEVP
jgi:hypothetical protein